jgi:hypothetical protein
MEEADNASTFHPLPLLFRETDYFLLHLCGRYRSGRRLPFVGQTIARPLSKQSIQRSKRQAHQARVDDTLMASRRQRYSTRAPAARCVGILPSTQRHG